MLKDFRHSGEVFAVGPCLKSLKAGGCVGCVGCVPVNSMAHKSVQSNTENAAPYLHVNNKEVAAVG